MFKRLKINLLVSTISGFWMTLWTSEYAYPSDDSHWEIFGFCRDKNLLLFIGLMDLVIIWTIVSKYEACYDMLLNFIF